MDDILSPAVPTQQSNPLDRSRRAFLRDAITTVSIAGVAGTGLASGAHPQGRGPTGGDPFTLGVASGDPLPESVVLWTRLATDPLEPDGGLGESQYPVRWTISTDETLTNVVGSGTTQARPEYGHSIHIDVRGLSSNTEYYYQFAVGPHRSPIGRTKTAPAPDDSIDAFSFAFASCQHYPTGYYTAHAHLAEEELDLAIHLGDYIYEGGNDGSLDRAHEPSHEIETLDDYRVREAQYKTDPDLQAAHASCPWVVTWDDHEVENNYADAISENDDPTDAFLARRANAYQAYFEHQPLRPSRIPDGPNLPLYRRLSFGGLLDLHVLDTRQYRDDQVYSDDAAGDPDRTLLGDEQEQWLLSGLEGSTAQWNVLANQVPFAATDENPNPDVQEFGGGDKWDGYRADRQSLLAVMAADASLNPVVITGDVHRNYAYDLKADFTDPDSPVVGTEYICTSISSFGDGSGITSYGSSVGEPWQRFYNDERGYVRCTITEEEFQTDYRVVSTVEAPTADVTTRATFTTAAGDPGATLASEPPSGTTIEITDVNPDQNGDLTNEFVELQNTGSEPIDLAGFQVSFEGGYSQFYTFDELVLEPGATVTVRNGTGEETEATRFADFGGPVLNNSTPDVVVVASPEGIVLDEASYSPV